MVITSNLLQSSSSRTTILLSPQPSPRLLIKVMKNIQLNILMTTFLNGQFLLEVQGCHHVKITCFLSTHRFKSIFICLKNNTACVFVIKTMMYKKKRKLHQNYIMKENQCASKQGNVRSNTYVTDINPNKTHQNRNLGSASTLLFFGRNFARFC